MDVKNIKGEEDKILIISVRISTDKVIESFDGNVYLRQGERSVKLNMDQILQLRYDRGQSSFEDEILQESSLDDIDEEIVTEYKNLLDLKTFSIEDVLYG
ncbi:putative DNA binding domain-containing protein [Arcanobacterium phocae]|uniref:hypothetical protein n=1 Tax=Arcanobacterium phocae TaxID=131112 RepID=UPI0020A06933|nr:hypothetical protein [Arcanobacterium phocae]